MFISTRTSRIALLLFAVYLVIYGGFVLLAAFSPQTMEATPLAGVNLAIWYGFGLIVVAILLALIYGFVCRDDKKRGGQAHFAPRTPENEPVPDSDRGSP